MKSGVAIKLASVALGAACIFFAAAPRAAAQDAAAPQIKVVAPQDVKDLIAANKGKVVFLNFFATYCVPCHTEFPDIEKLQKKYGDKIQVVEVSMNDVTDAAEKAQAPLKDFMLKQTRRDDMGLFLKLAGGETYPTAQDVPFRVLVPAFVTSELKTGFQIGFLIFLPFLVIDIVVAAVMMSLGMMLLSPVSVSLPLKLALFVLVNGWTLVIGSLAEGFIR